MEPVLFYGVPHGCSFGSIVALEWLGQPYRLCRIDMLAKDPRYARINPSHQTPALLLESGETLMESLAILHNIAARDSDIRLGARQGTLAFDRFNEAMSFLHTDFHSAFGYVWNSFKLPDGSSDRDALRRVGRDKAAKICERLDALLADRKWIAGGDEKSAADAYFLAIARWGIDLDLFDIARDYPRVHAHMQTLEADRGVIFAHAVEDEKQAQTSGAFLGHAALEEIFPRLAA